MRLKIVEKNKIAELWLTKDESDDLAFRESLRPLCRQLAAQNYLVALFLSGEADLYLQTRDLLLHNRDFLVERAAHDTRSS